MDIKSMATLQGKDGLPSMAEKEYKQCQSSLMMSISDISGHISGNVSGAATRYLLVSCQIWRFVCYSPAPCRLHAGHFASHFGLYKHSVLPSHR
jgi:hypothetical protein